MPDIIGKTGEEAEKIMTENELELVINSDTDVNLKEFIITEQIPQSGIKINKGNKVYAK